MKDGFVLLVIGVVGIVGLLMWRADIDPFHPARYFNPAPEPRASTEPDVPAPKPVASPRKAAPVHIAEAPAPAAIVEAAPVPVEIPAAPEPVIVQHDPLPFPAVEQIASGSPEGDVTEKYGHPAISAMTSSGGHMLGTYVYARDGGRLATVIHLEDGKVASALSKSAPVTPAGVSVPRWRRAE